MPEIIEFRNAKHLRELRERARRGELEELKGAWKEPVFIRKTKGDMSRQRREAMEEMRRRRAKELIEKVAQRQIKKT